MPRPRRDKPEPPNSLVASAAQITSRRKSGMPKNNTTAGWQDEVWRMLDTVGELEFYREWISNALSRVELYVEEETAEGATRVTGGLAGAALAELFGGEAGQSQMLAALAGHLGLPGESWLVGLVEEPENADGPDRWRVLAKDEVKREGSKVTIDRGDDEPEIYEDGSHPDREATVLLIRIWRPHPRKWVEAHSSVRSALPILRELEGLTKHVAATIDSRLAGAGILFVPQEMTFTTPLQGEAPADDGVDPFMLALTEAMTTAIRDRGDASAVVPIVIKAPAQYLDKIKHVTFWSEFAGEALELRKEALQRLANSLDVPPEVLTGLADVNHWTGWLLDENAIKMHIEPLVELICHAITTKFLWPILQGTAQRLDPALRRFQIKGDTSALRQRPNRTAEAQALHGDMRITDDALARETGFEEGDLLDPKSEEYRRRLLERLVANSSPEVSVAAAAMLGVRLILPEPIEPPAPAPTALPAGPSAPTTPVGGPRDIPDQQAAAMLALYVGAEGAVERAVERAQNRVGKRGKGARRPMKADQLDAALAGAWEGRLPRLAELTGVDQARLLATLDRYTRSLLTTGAAHDPKMFAKMLQQQVWEPIQEQLSA